MMTLVNDSQNLWECVESKRFKVISNPMAYLKVKKVNGNSGTRPSDVWNFMRGIKRFKLLLKL